MNERNHHEPIDAATARELLQQEQPDTAHSERDVRLWWLIQQRLIKDTNEPERSKRMAELHTHLCQFPDDDDAAAELADLDAEIHDEALQQLQEEEAAITHGERNDYWS
jgi:hypothetical protein